jgi:hypothetical protein
MPWWILLVHDCDRHCVGGGCGGRRQVVYSIMPSWSFAVVFDHNSPGDGMTGGEGSHTRTPPSNGDVNRI